MSNYENGSHSRSFNIINVTYKDLDAQVIGERRNQRLATQEDTPGETQEKAVLK